ncbi:nucleotidyltransferase family protein [Paraurantiacibacter namhicola]|uniref:Purine catabolism protein PucB n=1 Tax=Paraurantiacibacter namhicola TaxID=645517 RepID=A0A1C7DAT6_9SPHN|nr:nucleotidyltransferase family protein [Paraurantiacibacter namhicola]ANU08431.1 Purine catabolism protein PucB [Paraurantiacibacter namhicola]
MIAATRVGAVLLAAGRSSRFGPQDKLAQPWRGKPLALHAAGTLAAMPFVAHAVVSQQRANWPVPSKYMVVTNPAPDRGLASSIALGARALADTGVEALLFALADMPLVPQAHLERLLGAFETEGMDMVATIGGGRPQVPAVFGRAHFDMLMALTGDQGARDMLGDAATVACDAKLLADFDRPEDFAR